MRSNSWSSFVVVAAVLLGSGSLAACSSSSTSGDTASQGTTTTTDTQGGGDAATRGKAVAEKLACGSCHTGKAGTLAGADAAISGADGLAAWAPNLTPDKDTGIGDWSDAQIIDAVRKGVDDEGAELCPSMTRFPTLTDGDAADLVAYLRSLPAVSHAVDESVCPPLKPAGGAGGAGQGGAGAAGGK